MKRLIFSGLVLLILIAATVEIAARFSRAELDPNNWLAELAVKHRRLDSLPGRRLIFVGDSILSFGLDSSRLEQKLGRPVANMGLYAPLGLPFYFEEVKQSVRPGDELVAILYYYPSQADVNEGSVCHALDFYPAIKSQLDISWLQRQRLNFSCDIKRTLRYALNRFRGNKPNMPLPAKSDVFESAMSVFNPYGDIYDDLQNKTLVDFTTDSAPLPNPSQDETVQTFNRYGKELSLKGIPVLLVYPPFPETLYNKDKVEIDAYDRLLRQQATGIKILNHPSDSVLPDNDFFNLEYHLNTQGKKQYTDYLAQLLAPILK